MEAIGQFSDLSLTWKDPVSELSSLHCSLLGIILVFSYIFGYITLPPILSFERFGGDPQKRGLNNQVKALSV